MCSPLFIPSYHSGAVRRNLRVFKYATDSRERQFIGDARHQSFGKSHTCAEHLILFSALDRLRNRNAGKGRDPLRLHDDSNPARLGKMSKIAEQPIR